jgi:hypothetical protein
MQDGRHRRATRPVIEVHRRKAALVVMYTPERQLLAAMRHIERAVDVEDLHPARFHGRAELIEESHSEPRRFGTKALRKMLDSVDRTGAVILTTKTGRPWKPRYFKRQWEAASTAAGITDLHFHDLRGTAVTMLAEAGCTTPQIAAITGHLLKTVTAILDKYLARTRALAGEAVIRFENAKATKFANCLQTRAPKPSKGDEK